MTSQVRLRVGVGISTLLASAAYGIAIVAAGVGPERDQLAVVVCLAVGFAVVLTLFATVIANNFGPTHSGSARTRSFLLWVVVVPAIAVLPVGMVIGNLTNVSLDMTPSLWWMAGGCAGVGYAALYARRNAFAIPSSRLRSRLVAAIGVGLSMATAAMVVPMAILFLGIVVAGLSARNTPPPEYVFPETFSGRASLTYPDSSAQPGKRNGKGWIHEFPASGQLRMSDAYKEGQPSPKFYLVDGAGRRRPIERGSDAECDSIVRKSVAPTRAERDLVCVHSGGFDGTRYLEQFVVLRTTKGVPP